MKVKIIYGFAPIPKSFAGITIYPFIFTWYKKDQVPDRFLRHEATHVWQVRRYGWVSFYTSYLLYWFAGLIKYKNLTMAYREIPYEQAARDNERDDFVPWEILNGE